MVSALLAGSALAAAPLATAQTVPNTDEVPQTGLNLPSEITTFGKVEPNVRKATAIINGEVVTGTDIDQRLALIVLANGGQIPDEERERLRLQVLRNIIDETLEIQEAKAHEITIAPEEVDQSYVRVAKNFKRTPDALNKYLREVGSSNRSLKRQIQGELAWSRLLRRRVEPNVNVSTEEVQAVLDRLHAAKGSKEYRIGEIYLSATPGNQAEVTANANKIIERLKAGGSFPAYAQQFSEASTARVGGDLGWVRAAVLPEEIARTAADMAVGQVSGPVTVPGGVSIVYLADQRQVGMPDPRDATLTLRQLSVKFSAGNTLAQTTARAEAFASATRSMGGCGKADEVARAQGAELVDNTVKVRDLPAPLQTMLLKLNVGETTPPFGSQSEGVRVLVLCGRDEAAGAGDPSFESVRSGMEETRVNQRAQRYLRDLRRDAVIDYR